ncbi:unnamed protein product [Ectocarpus sp. CCAP 1310/34]|nr:unnamed protein product [Ectocarpus sp. CCAP 1310/34]
MCRKGRRGPPFDPCERVAVFMWRLGGDSTVRQTALQFGLSDGTVSQVTLEVARRVDKYLRDECVWWPSPEEQRDMSAAWELEKHLRGVIGAIDGSHIKILAPPDSLQTSYYNYKHFYSISLLAIVDNEGMFRWFCSGAPGACADSGVLTDTAFYEMVQEDQAQPVSSRQLFANGACILGDSAFAESPWMRTPIGKPDNRAERFFNYKHSSMRFRVEHAFGRLKKKFRALLNGLDCHLDHCPTIVNACVILHNFIFMCEGESPADHGVDNAPTRNGTGRALSQGAGPFDSERAREVDYLRRNFLQREWGAAGSRMDQARLQDERRARRNNGTAR